MPFKTREIRLEDSNYTSLQSLVKALKIHDLAVYFVKNMFFLSQIEAVRK
jgi:hypothetical protein